jgi:hypothetical protein
MYGCDDLFYGCDLFVCVYTEVENERQIHRLHPLTLALNLALTVTLSVTVTVTVTL